MPKTKDDRRSRRQEGDEPYQIGTNSNSNSKRGYSDGDRHQGKNRAPVTKHRNNNQNNNNNNIIRNNEGNEHAPCATFDDMNLKPDLLKGIYAYGFEKPSAIQQRAIKPIIRGRDVIAQSQSGTGKTVRKQTHSGCEINHGIEIAFLSGGKNKPTTQCLCATLFESFRVY